MLDRFLDAGGNFVDTADTYSDGGSEETLAPWLARRRDEVVLATKCRFPVSDPGGEGLAPERIEQACDASLRRLGVDVIDLYQVHAPDPGVPLEDTLAALDALVQRRQGARARRVELPGLAARLGGRAAGSRGLGAVRLAAAAVLARRALDRDRAAAVLPRRRPRRDPVGAARRRLPERQVQARRAPARGQPDRRRGRDAGRRPTSGARTSATSASSTPRARSPRRAARRSRRSRSPGCSAPRASPRRSSARARSSSSRTCSAPTGWSSRADERARLEEPIGPPQTYPQRMLREQSGIVDWPALVRAR